MQVTLGKIRLKNIINIHSQVSLMPVNTRLNTYGSLCLETDNHLG